MSIKTHTACRNKNKIKVKFSTAVSLCAYAATRMGKLLFIVVVYFERIVMTYSIIIKAKLFYLWTTYLCAIFASLLCFHQSISIESINSIVLCSFYEV
jgi:hypothetical protein